MLTMETIKKTIIPLAEKYNIIKVDLFGSYANGTATEKSDLDLLVAFNKKVPSIFKVMGFKEELSMCLHHPVDIITLPLVNPDALSIEKVVHIYERA